MPQVSMDCLGLLLLKVNEAAIHHKLHQQYLRNSHPVAFFDESFEMDPARQRFYVIAVAVVHNDELDASREALSSFYGGRALHAAPMFDQLEFESLRQATRLASKQNDGMDVVIYAPIEPGTTRDEARARCIQAAAAKVHNDFDVSLFVLDANGTPTQDNLDQRSFSQLRSQRTGGLHRNTVALHCRPSQELLLGLPDLLAWSYRQVHTRRDPTWFDPFREYTEVTII